MRRSADLALLSESTSAKGVRMGRHPLEGPNDCGGLGTTVLAVPKDEAGAVRSAADQEVRSRPPLSAMRRETRVGLASYD